MHRAHVRDAVNTQKFFFRRDLYSPQPGVGCDYTQSTPAIASSTLNGTNGLANGLSSLASAIPPSFNHDSASCSTHGDSRAGSPTASSFTTSTPEFGPVEEEYGEFTINEIINGKKAENFPGLMGVVGEYLDGLNLCTKTRAELDKSLELIKRRANGSLLTTATWTRNFVRSHPSYKFDSVISEEINYDLVKAVDELERGERKEPTLLPDWYLGSSIPETDAFKICCEDVMGGVRI